MHPEAPQNPYFPQVKRNHLNERELDAPLSVVKIKVYGGYMTRGEHRKEVVEKQYEAEVEVPEGYNKGHVKLAINRYVSKKLKGIRARTYYVDESVKPKPIEQKRRVRDFISERGMRDNERMKREYDRQIQNRRAEAEAMANGQAPGGTIDDTEYGADGLPKFSDKTYLAQ